VSPVNNSVTTASGQTVNYDYLVIAPGIQVNWSGIKGLPEALGKDGVSSNYSVDHVEKTAQVKTNTSLLTHLLITFMIPFVVYERV
jgi:NADH dehydrogenase FAD-containing subunit